MSVSCYEFDVLAIYHTRLTLAATSEDNAREIANGLMDKLFSTGSCELIRFGKEDLIGAEAFTADGDEVFRKGEI